MINKEFETLTFTYTIGEMCVYLKKNGYTVDTINIYDAHSVYYNDVEYVEGEMMIAYKGEHPYPNHKENSIHNSLIEQEIRIVFRHELSRKLLYI